MELRLLSRVVYPRVRSFIAELIGRAYIMKRYTNLGGLVIVLAMFSSLWGGDLVHAQVDAFTFFIPFYTDDMAAQVAQGRSDSNAFINADIEVTVSIAVLSA